MAPEAPYYFGFLRIVHFGLAALPEAAAFQAPGCLIWVGSPNPRRREIPAEEEAPCAVFQQPAPPGRGVGAYSN